MKKITPALFIGLGGSGANALLQTKRLYIDTYGKVPPMVSFLAIDTNTEIERMSIRSGFQGDITFAYDEVLCIHSDSLLETFLCHRQEYAWIPSQNVKYLSSKDVTTGRSTVRLILQENTKEIRSAILEKVHQLYAVENNDVDFSFETDASGVQCPVKVNVVCSIAGGTGSGMIVDMLHLIPSTMDSLGIHYSVFPWILMPDVFCSTNPAPITNYAYSNAYGVLRELDYLFNLSPLYNKPLTFGDSKVICISVRYAYLINNSNDYVDKVNSPNDMIENIGRSMFMLTDDMGTYADDIMNKLMISFYLNADGKSCWCASVGSAELVYDSQKVGDCIGYAIIRSVAKQLCEPSSPDISDAVMQWMSFYDVNIRTEQLPDSLLSDRCFDQISLVRNTQSHAIEQFINRLTNVENELNRNCTEIKNRVIIELNKKIIAILNTPHGVGDADAFLKRLQSAIEACEKEMQDEIQVHRENAERHKDWDSELEGIRRVFFGIKTDKRDELCQTIYNTVSELRNIKRKQYALNVYDELKQSMTELSLRIIGLKSRLKALQEMMSSWILNVQQEANVESRYIVNLHLNDVNSVRKDDESDSFNYIQENNVSYLLYTKNETAIFDLMMPWVYKRTEVQQAFGKSLNAALEELQKSDPSALVKTFENLKRMSSPMWKVGYEGKNGSSIDMITFSLIGCDNVYNNIIRNNSEYAKIFQSTDDNSYPNFVDIGNPNKMMLLTVSCFAPVYAVKNTMSYKTEFDNLSPMMAGYLDECWNQRMLDENFQIIPNKKFWPVRS